MLIGMRGERKAGMVRGDANIGDGRGMSEQPSNAQDAPDSPAPAGEIEERTALFSGLGERLLEGESREDSEQRAYLLRLLTSLMPAVEPAARRTLIDRIAAMPSPPTDLALALARDDPRYSAELLRHGPFSERELAELISRTGPEHHIEIAKRADLTLNVWLALARATARRVRGRSDGTHGDRAAASQPKADAAAGPAGTAGESPQAEAEPPPVGPGAPAGGARKQAPDHPRPAPAEPPPEPERGEPFADTPLLDDPDAYSWRFETDRAGRLLRLSPNAEQAFGRAATSLTGEDFAGLMQAHAAAPAADELGWAMRRRTALRDIVVETLSGDGTPRRWLIRGQPRFSFPEGRFQGYVGTARDKDGERRAGQSRTGPAQDPQALLDRLAQAADRLARSADSQELKEYAETMKDTAETLKAMPQFAQIGEAAKSPRGPTGRR